MKALLVARKSLLEIAREPQLLFLELALPLIFVAIAAAAYAGRLQVTHPILASHSGSGAEPILGALASARYADGRPIFDISTTTNPASAEAALKERDATLWLMIRPGTANGMESAPQVTIRGDALHPRFYRASTIASSVLNRYVDELAGRPQGVRVAVEPLFDKGPETEFDLYAPGMILFALLMLIPQTAMLVAREIRCKTLDRLRLTRLDAFDLLLGVSLGQMAVAALQVVIVFAAALVLGFHNRGALTLAVIAGLVVCLSAVGQGLIVACFVENDSQAANVGSTLTMLQVFVSGAFYQLPPLTLFTVLGHQIDLFDIFPASHAFSALQQVLSFGAGVQEVAFRLGAVMLLSGLYFSAGVFVFHRVKMGRSERRARPRPL
jgi:ABC-2 type transport system permease protein